MSDEALQRTVRRVGAVLVLAVGTLSLTFQGYVEYGGYPLGVWNEVALLLTYGAFVYLVGSLLVGVAARFEGNARAESADGSDQRADGGAAGADDAG